MQNWSTTKCNAYALGLQMMVDYGLAEQIYATAKLRDVKHVKLWLGADIMLEYELEEADKILVSYSLLDNLD